jgi:hypothetical protein
MNLDAPFAEADQGVASLPPACAMPWRAGWEVDGGSAPEAVGRRVGSVALDGLEAASVRLTG